MTHHRPQLHAQSGVALLEALISVLIFSIGCLALIGLQAMSLKANADAKYRSDAAYLANQLISQMWVETPTELTTYAHNATGTAGSTSGSCSLSGTSTSNQKALAWIAAVKAQLGNTTTDGQQQISVTTQTTTTSGTTTETFTTGYLVNVTICWHQPSDAANQYHYYTASAQIGVNNN